MDLTGPDSFESLPPPAMPVVPGAELGALHSRESVCLCGCDGSLPGGWPDCLSSGLGGPFECLCGVLGVAVCTEGGWVVPALPSADLSPVAQVRGVLEAARCLPTSMRHGGDWGVAQWCVAALTQVGACLDLDRDRVQGFLPGSIDPASRKEKQDMADMLDLLFNKGRFPFRFLLRHAVEALGQGVDVGLGGRGYGYTHVLCDDGREGDLQEAWPFVASLRLLRGSRGAETDAELRRARAFADTLQSLVWGCVLGMNLTGCIGQSSARDVFHVVVAVYGGGLLLKDQVRAAGFVRALLYCSNIILGKMWAFGAVNSVGQVVTEGGRASFLRTFGVVTALALALKAVTRTWPAAGKSAEAGKYVATRGPCAPHRDMEDVLRYLRAFVDKVRDRGTVVTTVVEDMKEGVEVPTRYFEGINLELVKNDKGRRHDIVTIFLDCVPHLVYVCESTPLFA